MNIGTIQGGTNAGWRKTNPFPQPWVCMCGSANAKHWAKCPKCAEPRP